MTLGLSATPFEQLTGVEKQYLEKILKAELHDSKIGTKASDVPDVTLVNDCATFFMETSEDSSKLIYA